MKAQLPPHLLSRLHPPAARTLQRRMRAKVLYRQRRDRKIPVDLLGKQFTYRYESPLPYVAEHGVKCRVIAYNPETAMVKLDWEDGKLSAWWPTDRFWSEYKVGNLRDA